MSKAKHEVSKAAESHGTGPTTAELEAVVLGVCLVYSEKIAVLLDVPEDIFTQGLHKNIADSMKKMWLENTAIDPFTVAERLKINPDVLMHMAQNGLLIEFGSALDLLGQRLAKRRVLGIANSLLVDLERQSAEEAASKAMLGLSSLFEVKRGSLQRFDEIANALIAESEQGLIPEAIPTGLSVLDSALGDGIRRKTMTVIAGRPSMGKSALSTQIAVHNACKGRSVLLFSLEMSGKALATRIISTEAGIEPVILRKAKMQTDWKGVKSKITRLLDKRFWVDDDPAKTSGQMVNTAREIKMRHGLDLVIVDYLQRVNDVMTSKDNRNQLLGQISRNFAIMARQLDCAVILVSQLNRAGAGNRPTMTSIRDSGEIEQDADNILLIHRESYYTKDERDYSAEIIVEKQREGPTGVVDVCWDAERVRFYAPEVRYTQ